jgi:hypothetical protein
MDTTVFNWLNDDSDIMDSLVSLAALSEEPSNQASNNNNNAGTDILQYLFQPNDNSNPNDFGQINQPISPQPQQTNNQVIDTHVPAAATTPDPNDIITDPYLKSTVSVVQAKDNFVTFMPVSTPKTKKQSGAKKTKFKEPIFVTESPQSYNKKKKKSAPSNTHSSGDENSDDDMLLDEELAASNTSASQLKQMTSKERRQLRNKISARNFRVRRKGKFTHLFCIV